MLALVTKTIERNKMLKKGDSIVVGVSGGADSVCLLDVLNKLKDKYNLKITVVHINHCIRGKEADRDEAFVKSLAEKYGNDYKAFSYPVEKMAEENGTTVEEMGRNLRYYSFRKVAGEKGKIAVAHNKNDNCETMLMRFFRGTGVKGLGGISPVRGNIIRPLISVDRNAIEEYCDENSLNYCTDSTNNDTEYTRNKIRHNIIPLIEKEFNPSIVDAMYKTAEIMAGEEEYMDRQARMAYSYCAVGDKVLSVEKLLDLDKVILKRVLRLGFIDFSADLHDVYYEHIKSVESLLYKKNGKVVQLPHNLRASRINNCIIFSKHIEHKEVLYKLEPEEPKYIPEIGKTLLISKKNLTNPKILYTISFDYDKIKGDFYFRNRKAGDKIYLNGVGGRKSLKKIFSELKLSKDDKDSITLLAVDNDVLWIPNYKTSDMYKANEDTKNIVYMYLKEKEN